MTNEDIKGAPPDEWVVLSRKRERPEEGWKYAWHFSKEEHAREFLTGYPALWPDEEWRIVKRVTVWEVVQ